MRNVRFTVIITILILISAYALFLPSLQAETELQTNYWWQSLYAQNIRNNHIFNLAHEELELPSDGVQGFSQEAQDKLYDVASRFSEENIDRETFYEQADNFAVNDLAGQDFELSLKEEEGQENFYTIANRLTLDEKDSTFLFDERKEESAPNFNIIYSLSDSASFRAGLGKNFVPVLETADLQEGEAGYYEESDEEMDNAGVDEVNREDEPEPAELEETFAGEEMLQRDNPQSINWTQQERETGSIGISYSPADNFSLTADFTQADLFATRSTASKIFGLEYDDQLGNIRASYQIEEGEMLQQTTTGLQMQVLDFAQLSASYSLLDFEELENKLKQQTSVDLGLDVNVTDFSTFSLGYYWEESANNPGVEGEESNESNISASFTIDF